MPAWLRGDPSQWPPQTLDRALLYAEVDRTALQQGFTALAQATAREVLAFLDNTPCALRVVRDMPMYLLLVCCMELHHRRDVANPRSGVTLANLRALYSRGGTRNYASDTHLRDMLAWARLRGLLGLAATTDARVRRLEPTGLLIDMFRHWVNAFVRAGTVTLPPDEAAQALPEPDMTYEVLSYRISAYRIDGFVPTERYPLVQQLMQRRHGYHVFLFLIAAVPAPVDEAGAIALRLSLSMLAQRFQVSRGTIRNTLNLAESAGLLEYDGSRETVLLQPAFHALARRWMALEITWMAGLCHAAIAARARGHSITKAPE